MVGQSLYQFVHAGDVLDLERAHKVLLEKGQAVSKYYRLMKKGGGFFWVQCYAILVNNSRNMPKPQHIVSVCLVLGEDELDRSSILQHPQSEQQVLLGSAESAQPIGAQDFHLGQSISANRSGLDAVPAQQSSSHQQQRRKSRHSAQRKSRKIRISSTSPMGLTRVQAEKRQSSHLCASCLPSLARQVECEQEHITSIGSIRRSSDDSYSVVSSASSLQTNHDFSSSYSTSEAYATIQDNVMPPLTHITYNPDSNIRTEEGAPPDSATNAAYDEYHAVIGGHTHHRVPVMLDGSGANLGWIGPIVRGDDFNSKIVIEEPLVGFSQQACNTSSQHVELSSDWSPQVANMPQLVLSSSQHLACMSYNCPEQAQSSLCENSTSSQQYGQSPPYLINPNPIHQHHQVPVNNGYTMFSM